MMRLCIKNVLMKKGRKNEKICKSERAFSNQGRK